jgi:sugar lactone lactonase YvrE
MKWMWRDYPAPITAGTSTNSMLNTILLKGETWQASNATSGISPVALTADPSGAMYCVNAGADTIYKLAADAAPTVYAQTGAPVAAEAFGPDGTLYASQPTLRRIIAIAASGKRSVFASGIAAGHITVLSDGTIYASQPSAHDDLPSTIWRIDPNGKKAQVDEGIHNAEGILVTGDHHELFVAEGRTHWIYSYELIDRNLLDRQRYYWLHTAESASDDADDSAGTTDIVEDTSGYVYAATRMGAQVCDMNGRVESILTLPDGPVTSLTFAGKSFDTLAVVCGGKLYTRRMNIHGQPGFANAITLPDYGGG